jgi:HEAT repeat protein
MSGSTINSIWGQNKFPSVKANLFKQSRPVSFAANPGNMSLQKEDIFLLSTPKQPSTNEKSQNPGTLAEGMNGLLNSLKSSGENLLGCCNNTLNNISNKKANIDLNKLSVDLIKGLQSDNQKDVITNIALLGKINSTKAIPELVQMLEKNSTQPEVSIEIVNALAAMKDYKVVQPIIDVMMDKRKEDTLRVVSAAALAKLINRKASKPLFEILRDQSDSPAVRASAALALSEFPTIRNTEQLVRSLNDSSELVRANCVLSLGIIGNKEHVQDIQQLLDDSDTQVKANAALSLGNLKDPAAIPALVNALEDTNSGVIVSIARALNTIDKKASTTELISVLENNSNSILMRRNATACLQLIKEKQAIDVLDQKLSDKNEDLVLRNYALAALINMKATGSAASIRKILVDDSENYQLRINAAAGAGMLGDNKALKDLVNVALSTEVAELKNNCVNAIRSIVSVSKGKADVSPAMIMPFLHDDDQRIQAMAADTLGMLKATEAVQQLSQLANDKNEEIIVRAYSILALGNIGDQSVKADLLKILKTDGEHLVHSRAAAALYQLGAKKELFQIVRSEKDPFEVKNHAAGVLIGMGEKAPELEQYLKPGLKVTELHKAGILGQGIEVGVIDENIDPAHPEFDNRIIIEPLEHHGTLVAGNLGGNVSGVAPKSIIHGYNAFSLKDDNGINIALEKIIDQKIKGENDIKVVNASLGFNPKLLSNGKVQQIINRFDQLARMANKVGITLVVSAGNDGRDIPVPTFGTLNLLCLSNNVISVGATRVNGTPDDAKDDDRADFSSYPAEDSPRKLDVMAPGFEVTLPYAGGSYKMVDGTSFSSPFVAGLVTLMYQVNPNLKPEEVKSILKTTATKLEKVPSYMQGSGEVNPMMAVISAYALADEKKAEQLAKKLGVLQEYSVNFAKQQSLFKAVA